MPDIQGTSRRQTIFLRAFRKNPLGPPSDQWPSPTLLRRWLRKPAFRRALNSIRETLYFQADFLLAYAAASAARDLQQPLLSPDKARIESHKLYLSLLRLFHLRQRFARDLLPDPTTPAPQSPAELDFLARVSPDTTVHDALTFLTRHAPRRSPTRSISRCTKRASI